MLLKNGLSLARSSNHPSLDRRLTVGSPSGLDAIWTLFGSARMLLLPLPFNPSQAGREFFAVFFVMSDTLAAFSVAGTAFFCAGTVYVIMWTWHIKYI